MSKELIESLRLALEQSPENVPLRILLARALFDNYDYPEAEKEYRTALAQSPDDVGAKTGLAEVFYAQGKFDAALVICEELVEKKKATAQTLLVFSKILHQQEEYRKAIEIYRRAKQEDETIHDETLEQMSSSAAPDEPEEEAQPLREYVHGDPDGRFVPYFEKPRCDFSDVGGMEEVKDEIRLKIIHPLTKPEIFAVYGKKIGGGILMYGPPGCGKTHLARATAGEVKANFISVGISDVLGSFVGESERNLHDIFSNARANTPCILFFDELDALGASRRDMRQSAGRQVINQFLSELDGIESDNEGVLILGATNAPWHLDGAFRRPGRFDRIIFVPPPDEAARAEIMRVQLKDKPAAGIDFETLAKKTKDFSGADIKALIDHAIEEKLRDALKNGKPQPLTTKCLAKSIKKIKPTTREWFTVAKNHALYANESGLYNDILEYLKLK